MMGAIGGFFIWNYSRGLIFLAHGGAYLISLFIAVLSIILLITYPIFERLFTIWRRKVHQVKNLGLPDGAHFD